MRRRFALLSLLTAWLLATGSQWDAVQVFAWARMFTGYVSTMSVGQALEETFDAEKPCSLCCAVSKAKEQEKQQLPPEIRLRDKLVLIFQPTAECVATISNGNRWSGVEWVLAGRGRAEPAVPPPRA
ncbi:MAG: hypothetical protein IPP19_12465 [Verrucomicrobia bacterium]|nr:hypothetical protein [Verrucomicrobiota bacterium]